MSITVLSKIGCIYCDKTKYFLDELSVPYTVITLDPTTPEYIEQRDALFTKYNHKSFPLIIVGNTFIGGYTELQNSYATLQLHELTEQIGITIPIDF
jgi:glutaredoxin